MRFDSWQAGRRALTSAIGLACCLLAVGCGSAPPAGSGSAPPAGSGSAAPSVSGAGPQASHRVTKILVIMEENHSVGQVFPSHMPYLWRLARRYGRATAWSDIGHPSLPNYLAIFGGSRFNDPQDCSPAAGCSYPGPSVFGQALAKGDTARAYEESMPTPCDRASNGNYDVNHNPWAYFPSEATLCQADDVPGGTVAGGALVSDARRGALPTVGLITPNLIHDGHNGTLAQADAWLRSWVPVLISGPDWHAGRLAIVVVFDEGETTETVPFVLMAPGLASAVTSRALDHYALTRLIDQVAGAPALRDAARAPNAAPLLRLSV
jgi:phosphatidylinositol-3-phosphatase